MRFRAFPVHDLGRNLFNNNYLKLLPLSDVEDDDGRFRATSCQPWLDLVGAEQLRTLGRFVEITFSAGLADVVTRPVIRFWTGSGDFYDSILPAPALGKGLWRGRLPANITAVWVSPTRAPGPFTFEIESIRSIKIHELLGSFLSEPKRTFFAFASWAVGLEQESILNFNWIFGQAAEQDYELWRSVRVGLGKDIQEKDAPCFFIVLKATDVEAVGLSYRSLANQNYRNWRLVVLGGSHLTTALADDERVSSHGKLSDVLIPKDSFVVFLVAGDGIEPATLDCVKAEFRRRPELAVLYSDHVQKNGLREALPILKPVWSPLRQSNAPYVGRAAVVASKFLEPAELLEGDYAPERLIDGLLAKLEGNQIGHLPRPLFILAANSAEIKRNTRPLRQSKEKISIVIPSRDRSDLLEPCIRSLYQLSSHDDYEVIIVDNGSLESKTERLYSRFRDERPNLSILPAPGPFNFSRLCNIGAATAKGAFLVFLNNDTEIIQESWLSNLLDLASEANIGAVGANLLYPSGRLQHAGVVLGFGGVAGHFEEGAFGEDLGWLGGLNAPREVSAVTGACLMVEACKFEGVRGFDEISFPVELNDIDLCLRLAERGWRNVCDGRTQLYHHCSASRGGRRVRLQRIYAKERNIFRERWLHLIRDDPYFNPNLSLFRHKPRWA